MSPFYLYRCLKCREEKEVFKDITDDSKETCECNNEMVRVPQLNGVIWKVEGPTRKKI